MPKKYKLPMWILAGVGLLFIITGCAMFGESVVEAIVAIVLGLLIGVPMLALYPYFDKKRKKALRKAKKKAEAKRKKQLQEATKNFSQIYEVELTKKAVPYFKKEYTPDVSLDPYLKDEEELRYAIIFDGEEKVGEIVGDDAMDIRQNIDEFNVRFVTVRNFRPEVDPETGEKSYVAEIVLGLRMK